MRFFVLLTFLTSISLHAYDMGRGYALFDNVYVGGYFSADYAKSKNEEYARLDDVALLGYGNITDDLSFLVELEAAPFYTYDYITEESSKDTYFHKERLYLDYKYSQNINFRIGKQITPIGYWNLEPINVLRDTSSSPILSSEMFPKFLSGIDIYGYIPGSESLKYHLYGQKNEDLDEEYINIKNKHFYGISLENEVDYDFQYGGNIGEYISLDDKRSRFVGLNLKYENSDIRLQTEAFLSNIEDLNTNETDYKFASYIQSMYKINPQNGIVGRYEHFRDNALDMEQDIGIFGYSYRPVYSISIKSEYQINSDNDLNKFIMSFSVLF